jgi:hypothetical protein
MAAKIMKYRKNQPKEILQNDVVPHFIFPEIR